MGSSTVTMCSACVALRCAIIAAIDVLLPLPAAPTTRTMPFLLLGQLARHGHRQPQRLHGGDVASG